MDPVIPPEITSEAILAFSPTVFVPLIAGIVQVFVNTGMPIRVAPLMSLVFGVVAGVGASISLEATLFLGMIQGAVVGLAASGLWMQFSRRANGGQHG